MNIPKTFFQEEIRDGFCVSEMMKRSWAAQMEILDAINRLCDKYGLRWFADYGTLLGAIRHGGYIPWDDDLDISMPRKDFMMFLEHADEIGEGLVVRSFYNSETYMNFNAVVTHKADTLEWDDERMQKYHGCPFICYVDIFPWDYVPRDEALMERQIKAFALAYDLMYELRNIERVLFGGRLVSLKELKHHEYMKYKQVDKVANGCKELEKLVHDNLSSVDYAVEETGKLRQQLSITADRIAQMCSEEDADSMEYYVQYSGGNPIPPRRKKEWLETTVEIPFEFGTISVPNAYVEVVESKYGKDYAKPVRFTSAHGYPFFKNEIRVLIGGDTGEMLTDSPLRDPSVESIPEDIRQFLLNEDGNLKKIVLYGLSAADIVNNGKPGIEQIISYLSETEKDKYTVVFTFVPAGLPDFMEKCHLSIRQEYSKMIDQIGVMDNVILDDNPSTDMLWALISICDEYYGDECRLAEICRKYEIPVTIRKLQ